MDRARIIREAWYNPRYGYVSQKQFRRNLREHFNLETTAEEIRDFVMRQRNWQRFQPPADRNESERKLKTSHPFQQLQLDLADISRYSSQVGGYRYLLKWIDLFTKYAGAIPIRDKRAETISRELEKIVKRVVEFGYRPQVIHSDGGREFVNSLVTGDIHEYDSSHVVGVPYNPQTQGQVENWGRTIKNFVMRWLEDHPRGNFLPPLQEFIENYNHSVRSATGETPIDAIQPEGADRVNTRRKASEREPELSPLSVGQLVRVPRRRTAFDRGAPWSEDTHRVTSVFTEDGITLYRVTGQRRAFTRQQLLPITGEERRPEEVRRTSGRTERRDYAAMARGQAPQQQQAQIQEPRELRIRPRVNYRQLSGLA